MGSEDQSNPIAGVPGKDAFLQEVHEVQSQMSDRLQRGCLLFLQFPVIKTLPAVESSDTTVHDIADDALSHLLAIVATRVRARDTLGRISRHSLCILLKGCKQSDAAVVADQYVALLRDVVVKVGEQHLPIDMRYRIVPLDSNREKPGLGASCSIPASPLLDKIRLSKQIEIGGNTVDLSSSKVVSLNAARLDKQASERDSVFPVRSEKASCATVLPVGVSDSARSWRLRPGILVKRTSLVCCYRLQPIGVVEMSDKLQDTHLFSSILNALALRQDQTRPLIESQFIVSVQSHQIDIAFAEWLVSQCNSLRVAKSDICLCLTMDSLLKDVHRVAPVLRQLNRKGIRLMLEDIDSSSQFVMIRKMAHFDYVYISGRTLNDSAAKVLARSNLDSIIAEAREHHVEICSGGIDSPAKLAHALSMGIEIGFGRECGATTPFPAMAWCPTDELARKG